MAKPGEQHQIRMPGLVLDQIRTKEESGEYGKDSRFARKRKAPGKQVSRKDKRREERMLKKQKHLKTAAHSQHQQPHRQTKPAGTARQFSEENTKSGGKNSKNDNSDDPIAALKALKALKAKKNGRKESELKIVKEADILSGSDGDDFSDDAGFDGFSDIDAACILKGLHSDLRIVREDDLDDEMDADDFDSDDVSEELNQSDIKERSFVNEEKDPLTALAKLKQKDDCKKRYLKESDNQKIGAGVEQDSDISEDDFGSEADYMKEEQDPLAKLKALKEAKKMGINVANMRDKTKQSKEKIIEASFGEDNIDKDLEYYAKKLGLKNGKKSKLSKLDDDDIVGGLLDGLDLDFSDDNKGLEDTELGEDASIFTDEFSDEFSDLNESGEEMPKRKENPFVAPVEDRESEGNQLGEESKPSKYIPPAMRRKLALGSSGISAETLALQKAIKGPINKLSEANIGTIANEINGLFLTNPRQAVNENLTTLLMDSVIQQGRLLDTFVYLHSALVVAIYRTQGVDFGAHFIQALVEKLESSRADASKSKEALNTASLLSSVYAFQLVSSKLLYDIIRDLINDLSESNAELLLKIIRTSGNQMRSDDPGALKEIVLMVNKSASALSKASPRMQFLIDTIASLKNNKLKLENELSHQLTIRLKKFLGNFVQKSADPLQVSLDDIRNIESKGKWWLVGSAWKGLDEQNQALANIAMVNDVLDSAEPNWLELAKAQRMNTDIRRAIFISIMSANDYIDAVTKLDKLALKKAQEREIPRIVVHCAVVEPAWNPYYGILASKLCDSHSYRKTFQFMLWDLVKGFDGNDGSDDEDEPVFTGFEDSESDDDKLKKILNLGRLFGTLFAEGSLALHILRTVNFISVSADIKLFMEVLFVTFFDQIAKKSQVNSIGVGLTGKKAMSEQKFDDRTLIERILKAKDEPALLKGISHFISRNLQSSDFITGRRQRKRIEWGVKSMTDIIDEIVKESEL